MLSFLLFYWYEILDGTLDFNVVYLILYAFSYSQAKYFLVIPELYTYLYFAVIVFEDLHNLIFFLKN